MILLTACQLHPELTDIMISAGIAVAAYIATIVDFTLFFIGKKIHHFASYLVFTLSAISILILVLIASKPNSGIGDIYFSSLILFWLSPSAISDLCLFISHCQGARKK